MLIVQKYGGTSVGDPEKIKKVAHQISQLYQQGHSLLVVVSAMGHTTDELLEMAEQVQFLNNGSNKIENQTGAGKKNRELDMLLSVGERISMSLLCLSLQSLGVKAISLTGSQSGIITTVHHRRARIKKILGDRIKKGLQEKKVVIVAGFQGVSEEKEITTLGRGGSDTTAVALAAFLKADACEIYTDVKGVFSADPRIVENAHLMTEVSADVLLELAARGAQVLHPRSVELAEKYQVPIYIKSSAHQELRGTKMTFTTIINELPELFAMTSDHSRCLVFIENVYQLSEFAKQIASFDLNYSHLELMGQAVTMYVEKEFLLEWKELFSKLKAENVIDNYRLREYVVPLSLVGRKLSQDTRILMRLLQVCQKENVDVEAISATHQSIICGVNQESTSQLLRVAHQAFDEWMVKI